MSNHQIICATCGYVPLSNEQYFAQLHRGDIPWLCPICQQKADYDDDLYCKKTSDNCEDCEASECRFFQNNTEVMMQAAYSSLQDVIESRVIEDPEGKLTAALELLK